MQPEHQYHNPIGTEMFHQPKMTPYTFCNCKYMAKFLFHSPKCSPHTTTFHKQNLMFTTHAIYSPSKKGSSTYTIHCIPLALNQTHYVCKLTSDLIHVTTPY